MPPRRYKAPTADRAVLADPVDEALPALVEANRRLLDRADVRVGGMPLRELRRLGRREVLSIAAVQRTAANPDAPLILAGHQPELSHPGVWVKNFALYALARRVGGTPLNLVVDNDTLKSTTLRFPVLADDPAGVRLQPIPFDRFDGEQPYEDRRVHDPECFRTFADRAEPFWKAWGFEPLLPVVWREIVADPADTIGGKFASVRRAWERRWGCDNLELPVSQLARTKAFGRFVRHLVGDWPRFRDAYNRAVGGYRAAHGIANRSHPVPDLGPDEVPFWGPPGPDGRRGRAAVRDLPDPACLRPRALTLTLFARVCVGDFFIHGIGGGKYDEVTDAIIRDYFGINPPAFQVLSATLRLPLPGFPATPAAAAALGRLERDVFWNPHRHLPHGEEQGLVERHRELEVTAPADRAGRRQRYRDFRAVGDRLRPRVEGQLAEVRDQLGRAKQEAAANVVLGRRDFAWVLYPEEVLRPFLQEFLGG